MPTMSPTKNGEMKRDEYWILKYNLTHEFSRGTFYENIQPVFFAPATLDTYNSAPELAAKLRRPDEVGLLGEFVLRRDVGRAWREERWVGRRINGEVEVFGDGAEEDYIPVRQALQKAGFLVRSHRPQKEGKRFPRVSYKAAMEGESKNTLMKKCLQNLEEGIAERFPPSSPVAFGLLADIAGRVKTLGIARVDEDMFRAAKEAGGIALRDQLLHNSSLDLTCPLVGEIRHGRPKFFCGEEQAKAYFDSVGKLDHLSWTDKVAEREAREREEARAERKRAKKHRRQITASTPEDQQGDGDGDAAAAVVRARQREKYNSKRKAQRARKKNNDDDSDMLTLTRRDSFQEVVRQREEKEKKRKSVFDFFEQGVWVHEEKTGNRYWMPLTNLAGEKTREEDSSGSSGGEDGVKVVHAQTKEEIDRAVWDARKKGRPVHVAASEDVETRFLGKGL